MVASCGVDLGIPRSRSSLEIFFCIIGTCSKFLPVLRLQSFNHSARRIFGQAEEVARKEGISIRPPPTRRPPPRADSIDHEIEIMSIPYVRMSTYPVARERCHVEVSPPSKPRQPSHRAISAQRPKWLWPPRGYASGASFSWPEGQKVLRNQ